MYRPLLALGIRLACLRLVADRQTIRNSSFSPAECRPWSAATRLEGHIRSCAHREICCGSTRAVGIEAKQTSAKLYEDAP
jgi:hypothetical protein